MKDADKDVNINANKDADMQLNIRVNEDFSIENIRLIVGLGNVGKEYEGTRHNAGFMFLDELAREKGASFKEDSKFRALISEIKVKNNKIILAKPTTYMNNSGEAVKLICDYYRIEPEEVLIVHDDLDIELASVKVQFAKGPREHNGVASIKRALGTEEFWSIRIGIENRTPKQKLHQPSRDYVLGRSEIPIKSIFSIFR
jgi:PTH1 family peptidyl-tRNA hydrolase